MKGGQELEQFIEWIYEACRKFREAVQRGVQSVRRWWAHRKGKDEFRVRVLAVATRRRRFRLPWRADIDYQLAAKGVRVRQVYRNRRGKMYLFRWKV